MRSSRLGRDAMLQLGNDVADIPRRPPRKMPLGRQIAEYWQHLGAPFHIDADVPQCFCCRRVSTDWRDFDRAHLVDRQLGGLDLEANLAMLCPRPCHTLMPVFEIDEWEKAIQWVARQGWVSDLKPSLVALDAVMADDDILMWNLAGWLLSNVPMIRGASSLFPP